MAKRTRPRDDRWATHTASGIKKTANDRLTKSTARTAMLPRILGFLFDSIYQIITWVCIGGSLAALFYTLSKNDMRGVYWSGITLTIFIILMIGMLGDKHFFQGSESSPREPADVASDSFGRARLAVEGFELIFSKDAKTFTYQFLINNYGKRPATVTGISFTYLSGADENMLLDKPFYYPTDPRANVIYPGQMHTVSDDKWFIRFPLDTKVICCWGFVKYLSEGSKTERVAGYGFRWRSEKEITMIKKPGYNYDR